MLFWLAIALCDIEGILLCKKGKRKNFKSSLTSSNTNALWKHGHHSMRYLYTFAPAEQKYLNKFTPNRSKYLSDVVHHKIKKHIRNTFIKLCVNDKQYLTWNYTVLWSVTAYFCATPTHAVTSVCWASLLHWKVD